jgi:hypothetical protein
MNNATYAQILASWAERRKNLYHFSLFLLYFFVAYVLIRACWPGEDHMYYDAGWYWSVISSSDLDNAPKMYRGYLYPYILFLLKTCSVDLDVTIHSRPVQWLRPSIFEGYVRAANS